MAVYAVNKSCLALLREKVADFRNLKVDLVNKLLVTWPLVRKTRELNPFEIPRSHYLYPPDLSLIKLNKLQVFRRIELFCKFHTKLSLWTHSKSFFFKGERGVVQKS